MTFWRTYFWVYSGHNSSCISNDAISLTRGLAELKRRLLVEWIKLDHSIVVAAISQWRRHLSAWLTADISSTFCGVFMVHCVKLMLRIFEFGFLLFECFVYRQNVTCLKCFTMYGHYAGDVGVISIGRLARSCLLNRFAKKLERLVEVWWHYAKSSWFWFFCGHTVS